MEENKKEKLTVPKWGMIVWFSYVEQIQEHNENEEMSIKFQEAVGINVLEFNTYKDAVKFKNEIWSKGFALEDGVAKDWCKVIRVRIINHELVREQERKEKVELIEKPNPIQLQAPLLIQS